MSSYEINFKGRRYSVCAPTITSKELEAVIGASRTPDARLVLVNGATATSVPGCINVTGSPNFEEIPADLAVGGAFIVLETQGGFRRVYYDDVIITRNQLRGAYPIEQLRNLQECAITIRILGTKVYVATLNSLNHVVAIDGRKVMQGMESPVPHGRCSLTIDGIELNMQILSLQD